MKHFRNEEKNLQSQTQSMINLLNELKPCYVLSYQIKIAK